MKRSWLAALVVVSALVGCASEPTRLPLGTSRDQALAQLGTPTATYPLPNGGERLQYSRAPMGFEVSNIDVDGSGHVVSVRGDDPKTDFTTTIRKSINSNSRFARLNFSQFRIRLSGFLS